MSPPGADPAPEIPRVLPIRLASAAPSLGCTFFIGAFLTGIALVAWLLGRNMTQEKNGWLLYVFCGGFGFFGLLILWSFVRQIAIARVPATIVEISAQPFRIGQTARIALIQRGPVRLRSLRANLVCLEQHITWHQRTGDDSSGSGYRKVDEKLILTQNLVDAREVRALAGDTWQGQREFEIPADARPSLETDAHVILWRIELWGKAGFLGSFMHPFDVEVAGASLNV